MAAALAFISGGDIEEGAVFANESPFERCGLQLSTKQRLLGFAISSGIGSGILIIFAALYSVLGDNGGVYAFMIFHFIGFLCLLISPFFLYGPMGMLKKITHPFRVVSLLTVVICLLIVEIISPILRGDATWFVLMGTVGEIFCFLFFGFSLLPCFDKILGSCCGGFFSNQ
ncbi:hypothetical protein EHI8A_068930 [Entamoeba histolytica HM-1:IMSS-B]|uniref:Vesicle transport protein n=6 Tax=Entamoeba histolytica TaxID=5759 RepID=C4M3T4_ENTH1|nr:hypothetical protein EHI_163530 [Entamoeba histolytica HM-1:IMSS]EMD46972.1 Hypothetical protein EHI5A_072200 [Entamoeba histolytica KU27]EMH74733.1 hypothetical protein EHI8A_068930 [Entamoeba histolytica HM-1:IMSS-B]EMS14354.1 hypothetical protein KM1_128030 [Entamoeba histolytica HM-3:IMSS]ENY61743.1 hypothetical protein EHI7A_063050 [Entamoeba histolytica HM-1:IMSS-A]GAT95997.1 hypothetical protein CL6EHI_163530 [Entamoeba histolytica]|eukprot:XP_649969.1 hypothetical protein EHI_163530 [Entamoeba histolytica HM-1:IMSS]